MCAVPVHDLVLGDGRGSAVLVPGDVVVGDEAPGGVGLALDVVQHLAELRGGWAGFEGGGEVAEVVRLGPVVPRLNFDDVWFDFGHGGVPAVIEEVVGVRDPAILWVAVIQVFELPR